MNRKSEAEIIRILQTYGDMLYRTAYLLLGNPHDVQDVLQEVFLRYIEKSPCFASQDHKKAWLLRVTSNCCKDCLRFRKCHSYIDLELLQDYLPAPEEQYFIQELYALPAKWKTVLLLHYFEGYPVKDISKITGLSENAVNLMQMKESLTMLTEMADALLQNCTRSRQKHYRYSRYSRICAILAAIFCIGAVSSTSLAAYNVYQEKQLAIFMDYDLTQEEIADLGKQLSRISDIASYRYVSGDEAWEEFKANYLADVPELANSFEQNPLANSFNYRVSIRMGADTQAVRDQIGQLEGVRLITTIRELENSGGILE